MTLDKLMAIPVKERMDVMIKMDKDLLHRLALESLGISQERIKEVERNRRR